jgi:hypothetical protein
MQENWMDSDDRQDTDRQRPFSPPPDRFSTLSKVFIFVIALFLVYQAADWKRKQHAADIARKKTAAPITSIQGPAAGPVPASPQTSASQNPSETTGNIRTVTKCVIHGKTTYGDEACARGAVTSQVTTRNDHNLMAAIRPRADEPTQDPAHGAFVIAQDSASADAAAKSRNKSECLLLDKQVEYLDALARQPQGPQSHDNIRNERKKIRDRQSRIPCQ